MHLLDELMMICFRMALALGWQGQVIPPDVTPTTSFFVCFSEKKFFVSQNMPSSRDH